jgi:azurin
VILKLGQDYKNFANEVSAADLQAKGEIADSLLDKVIAHTKILGPGESQTIELIAPSAGTYDYLCTFPTHAVFMHGRMIVKS